MLTYLILLFTILPAIELAVLIHVGAYIGLGNTISLIILTGIVGASLARYQGFTVMRNIQNSLNQGNMPTDAMLDGLMIFTGGIVLLTPGFITDAIGFFLLIPLTRALIKHWVKIKIQHMMSDGRAINIHSSSARRHNDFEDADFHE
ncbi:MAG: membrane protein FxsA [Candidatus Omnitrophica bacterium]|nr:membrane protein FxsA [Candidatus Omnitrophota bacterium]